MASVSRKTPPRLALSKGLTALYVLMLLICGAVVVGVDDAFYRFAFFVVALAFSFQFWTFATAKGERQARQA